MTHNSVLSGLMYLWIQPNDSVPTLIVDDVGNNGANVSTAIGVTIDDPHDNTTIGNFGASTIVVNNIVNTSDYGDILFENLGNGNWAFKATDLPGLSIVVKDNGFFELILEAVATDGSARTTASSSATFGLEVLNTAPNVTIMEAPESALKDEPIAVRMAAVDPSSVDQSSGFFYRVNWGDGSAVDTVQGQPGVGPTLTHTYANSFLFTISVTATDKDGAESSAATHQIRVSFMGLIADPLNPAETMLVIEGTNGNDEIAVETRTSGRTSMLDVYRNNVLNASFEVPTSRIVVYGRDGHDSLYVSSDVNVASWLFGGSGDDILFGSSGDSILVGGDGLDLIRGRDGDDIIFGGRGSDLLFGGRGDNILLAGYSLFDSKEAALLDIQREWASNGSVKKRIAHLTGKDSGGDNGSTFLRGECVNPTAFDDRAVDLLFNDKNHDWILVNSDEGVPDLFSSAKYLEELDDADGEGEDSFFASLVQATEPTLDSRREKFLLDVNGDNHVTPLDALLVINRLNAFSSTTATESEDDYTDFMLDVNYDQNVSPIDALFVINHLNRQSLGGESEGNIEDSARNAVPPFGCDTEFFRDTDIVRKKRV